MKTIILAIAALSCCALPLRCLAQNVTPVIYLSLAESAKAKQVAQELKDAENRQRRAYTAWRNFYQSYQAAHPEMPGLRFASDFRFAFTRPNSSDWVAEVASVPLSPKEQRKAESLHGQMENGQRAFVQAQKAWVDYQYELVSEHYPNPDGGQVFLLKDKSVTIPGPWNFGVAFTPDFKIAIPKTP